MAKAHEVRCQRWGRYYSRTMLRPDSRNLITDVDGIRVGNADNHAIWTGVTVILWGVPAIAAVDVRGSAQ